MKNWDLCLSGFDEPEDNNLGGALARKAILRTLSPIEQTKFWRDATLGDVELLRATYVTHSFSRHMHECYAIGVIDAGVEEFSYRGMTHRAGANQIVVVHPGEVHTGQAGVPSGWQYRMFYPQVSLLQRAAQELHETSISLPYFPNPVITDPELAGQMRRLHKVLEHPDSQLERDSRFLWTFAQLIARHGDWCSSRDLPSVSLPLQPILDYLQTHYAESISLEQLANLAHLKPLRFLRWFQREMGLPPHAYLLQVRVEQAKRLLAAGVPIAQVAVDTGFSDQSHLHRHFKRWVGITPGQYALGCR